MLKVRDINVFYGDLQALWDISFKVEKGEIVALIGSNGAGKTTTLKTISGLLHPQEGSIEFMGRRIEKQPAHKIIETGIVQVPEGRKLFPYMTTLENLELGAYIKRARKRKHEALEWIFQLFPILKERKNQLAGTLSGGEQQMLAIARALISKPKLLMLDEPSFGLAPKLVLKIFETIKELNRQGITILLVEQHVRHALELAERAYVIEAGKITLAGKPEELLQNDYIRKAYLGI